MQKNNSQLIAVDLDGTLLRSDHELAPEGAQALAEAARSNVRVIIASARNPYSARRFARQIGLTDPLVCSNGAQVWASPGGPVWSYQTLPLSIAEAVIALADARGWSLMTTVGNVTYRRLRAGEAVDAQDAHHVVVATNVEVLAEGVPARILNYEPDAIAAIPVMLAAEFAGRYYLETYYNADSTVKSIGIYAPGVDKGTGLQVVLDRLGVDSEHVLAIGDNPNDLPMFVLAHVRVAMGNATADVRQQATVVAPTNDDEGVAWAVRRFVLDEN